MKYKDIMNKANMRDFLYNGEFNHAAADYGYFTSRNSVLGADDDYIVFAREKGNELEPYILSVEALLDSVVAYIGSDSEGTVLGLRGMEPMPMVANDRKDGMLYTHHSGWGVMVYDDGSYIVREPCRK